MIQLITKADLPTYTKVSANVADLLINPAIRDAHLFDVGPQLGAAEQQALAAYLASPDRAAYAASYAAAEAQGFPPADLAVLQASPLYARHVLYITAVRPLLCYHTYRRFLLDHGAHITENGVEFFTNGGSNQPISQAQRTDMRADAASKCAHFEAVLAGALRTYRGPSAAAASCGTSSTRRPTHGGLRTMAL